jgi:hypothetical protein
MAMSLAMAQRRFKEQVEDLLDDPSSILLREFPAHAITVLRESASHYELDFDALIQSGTGREHRMFLEIESGVYPAKL